MTAGAGDLRGQRAGDTRCDRRAFLKLVSGGLAQVTAQIRSGEARLVFDPEAETANIVLARDLPEQ